VTSATLTAFVTMACSLPRSVRRAGRRRRHTGAATTGCRAFGARNQRILALEAGGTFAECAAADGSSRIVAVCGRDGAGKSKVCAALLELSEPTGKQASAGSPLFADKSRLLEAESAESRRNFSCYNHTYSQWATKTGLPQRLHMIDTPGHVERLPLMNRALHAAHGAIMVCSASEGVNAECGRVFASVLASKKPSVLFLNGIDLADDKETFETSLDALEQRLGIRPVVLFAPIHLPGTPSGSHLLNVLDTSMCTALECSLLESGANDKVAGEIAAWAKQLREQQIESLAAVDDEMMSAFVEFEGEVPQVLIESALCRAVAAGLLMPLVAGSAKTGMGIDVLQETVKMLIPGDNSDDLLLEAGVEPVGGVSFSPDAPFLGYGFAHRKDGNRDLLEVRILDGTLKPEQKLKALSHTHALEAFTPSQMLAHGTRGSLVPCQEAGPGDLVLVPAPPGLGKLDHCGLVLADLKRPLGQIDVDTLADNSNSGREHCTFALDLSGMERRKADELCGALDVLVQEDDGLRLVANTDTGEQQLSFLGTLHLELVRERLAEEFKILNLPLVKPKVPYHAVPRGGTATATGLHEPEGRTKIRKGIVHKHTKKADAWAKIELTAQGHGTGVEIEVGDELVVSAEISQALKRGVKQGLRIAGPGGLPVTDVHVRLLAAEAQGDEAAQTAAEHAAQKAAEALHLAIMEPVVNLKVDVPGKMAENVMNDLKEHRRGEVWGKHPGEGDAQVIEAEVPLREIVDYASTLQKLTDSKGFYSYQMQGYREVEERLAKDILAQGTRGHKTQ